MHARPVGRLEQTARTCFEKRRSNVSVHGLGSGILKDEERTDAKGKTIGTWTQLGLSGLLSPMENLKHPEAHWDYYRQLTKEAGLLYTAE